MQKYRPIIVIRWLFLIGFFIVLPFGAMQFSVIPWTAFTYKSWAALAFIVICVTFFTYLWNIYALRVLNASVAGAYIYLQPIFAAIISVLVMGEHVTWQKTIAAIFIFTGVISATRSFKKSALAKADS